LPSKTLNPQTGFSPSSLPECASIRAPAQACAMQDLEKDKKAVKYLLYKEYKINTFHVTSAIDKMLVTTKAIQGQAHASN
jgi:hypothetical protein